MNVLDICDAVLQSDAHASPAAQAVPPGPVLTPFRIACPPGLGPGVWDQAVPFQCRINVCPGDVAPMPHPGPQELPTAQAADAAGAEMPLSQPSVVADDDGVLLGSVEG